MSPRLHSGSLAKVAFAWMERFTPSTLELRLLGLYKEPVLLLPFGEQQQAVPAAVGPRPTRPARVRFLVHPPPFPRPGTLQGSQPELGSRHAPATENEAARPLHIVLIFY